MQTPVWLAGAPLAPEPDGGFFSKSRPDTLARLAQDHALARQVYDKTAILLGVDPLSAA